jgi:hypothetical protein
LTDISSTSSAPAHSSQQHAHALLRHVTLAALTLCTFLIHGYHPLAEDGGLYVAGIESALNPALFPHDIAFASATRHYSLFSPLMAHIVTGLHIPLPWLLLFTGLLGTWIMLYAAWRIAAPCVRSHAAQLCATALLAAWFTLPIAGTSLLLMDPYVTARTLSTPLSLVAVGFALPFQWDHKRPLLPCIVTLAAAALFHPLMAAYAAALIIALLVAKLPSPRARTIGWIALAASAVVIASVLQAIAPPESPATIAAAYSRYYWFLSRWQWFELLGLIGPLAIFALLLRFARRTLGEPGTALCRAAIAIGLIAALVSLLFAHERYSTHLVARLQPLRTFLLLYAVMAILLAAALAQACFTPGRRPILRALPPLLLTAMAVLFFCVDRQSFPASPHLELPWRAGRNAWSQAFLWARNNTPTDALFALDANYITTQNEDAQTFRATAQRSMLPDFSKDGGEAAIRPALAETWFAGMSAQKNLSRLTDQQRGERLRPLGVTWIILHADAPTATPCPYRNALVKVCPLAPEPQRP